MGPCGRVCGVAAEEPLSARGVVGSQSHMFYKTFARSRFPAVLSIYYYLNVMESTPPRLAILLAKILRVKVSFGKLACNAFILEKLSSCHNGILTRRNVLLVLLVLLLLSRLLLPLVSIVWLGRH